MINFLKKPTNIFLTLSVFLLIFAIGFNAGKFIERESYTQHSSGIRYKNLDEKNTYNVDFSLFWEAWNKLDEQYVDKDKLDPKTMFYGAIKGMVASLDDPYTFFLTPEENKKSKDDLNGKFEGIGAQLGLRDSNIVIIAPLKNSPSEKAGALAGDIIRKVDNVSTQDWSLQKAVNEIRGERGTTVQLTLERGEETIIIDIVRDQIIVPSTELEIEDGIAILKLNRFGEDINDEWSKSIKQIRTLFERGEVRGMVLDLRDNPGGYLRGAIYVASEFLTLDTLVVTQQYGDKASEEYRVDRKGVLPTIPLLVLINNGSASASEIVAGALRDYNRAQLVGAKSFGKGSIQQALDLSQQAGIHITVAKWILPKGDWINEKGIMPQHEVENEIPDGNTLTRSSDLQLEKAIELLVK